MNNHETALLPRPLFVLVAVAVVYICFFSRLDALGLVGPDEPRYASVARAIAESGDWVTPRLDGQPWFEKPVLYYWSAAAAFKLFGVNETAARLPSAIAALLATLALAWAAKRFYGTATAQAFVLIFPTCVGTFGFARAATTDMLFSASLAMALACAAALVGFPSGSRPERYWLFLFGAALGLATLAKGPAAIVLAGGSTLLWALVTHKWREAFRLSRPEAVLAFAAVALPWYILCALRNPDFVQVFLVSHNVERFLTPVFRHEQPFWFYGPILLLGLVPWTALLISVGSDAWRATRDRSMRDSAGFFLACWVLFPLLFFSISKSKLPGYILPAIPPLALLMARSLTRAVEGGRELARWLVAGVGVTFVALAGLASLMAGRLPATWLELHSKVMGFASAVAIITGVGIMLAGILRRPREGVLLATVVLCSLIAVATFAVLPQMDPFLGPRAASATAGEAEQLGKRVYAFRLHRAWQYGLNFYLHRAVPEWTPDTSTEPLLLTSKEGLRRLRELGISYTVLVQGGSEQAIPVAIGKRRR